jgi:methylamine dehydrogenase accessory protein MauD
MIVVRNLVLIEELVEMSPLVWIVIGVTWLAILALGFLLLGALRALGLQGWRLEQLEATTPSRVGRNGLAPGQKARDFTLPNIDGQDVSLHDYVGRPVLLLFVQLHCGPCHAIVPELNRLISRGDAVQILAVNNGQPEDARQWATETVARFPVLAQQARSVSMRYEVFATPFAFLIDEQSTVRAKGIVGSKQHLGYLLSGQGAKARDGHVDAQRNGVERGKFRESVSLS